MHDAELHLGLGEDALDSLGKTREVVDASDEDVVYAAILEVRQDLKPELGSLVFAHVEAEEVFVAFLIQPDDAVDGLGDHAALVAYLVVDGIEPHERIDRLQRTRTPLLQQRQNLVRNAADRRRRNVQVVHLSQVIPDVTVARSSGVECDDLPVEIGAERAPSLGHNLRIEAGRTIPGCVDLDGAERGFDTLLAFAVAAIGLGLIVEMDVQFGVEALFEELLDQGGEHAVGAQQRSAVLELFTGLLFELLEVEGVRVFVFHGVSGFGCVVQLNPCDTLYETVSRETQRLFQASSIATMLQRTPAPPPA